MLNQAVFNAPSEKAMADTASGVFFDNSIFYGFYIKGARLPTFG